MEYPTGSGKQTTLRDIAIDLCDRLISLFKPDESGYRPCYGDAKRYTDETHWQDLLLFHEYFHAETGEGLGASHQTGWTSLVVRLVRERREKLSTTSLGQFTEGSNIDHLQETSVTPLANHSTS